jgi:hypothetical protein
VSGPGAPFAGPAGRGPGAPFAGPAGRGPGAPFAAWAHADRAAAALGEPFAIEVVLRHAAGDRWELDAAQDPSPFAIRSAGCDTRQEAGAASTRCALVVARMELGERVPELRLRGTGPGGTSSVAVRAPAVRAALVTDPATSAREIPLAGLAPPLPLLVPTWRPAAWGGLALAAALAVAVAARRRRRRARPRQPVL